MWSCRKIEIDWKDSIGRNEKIAEFKVGFVSEEGIGITTGSICLLESLDNTEFQCQSC